MKHLLSILLLTGALQGVARADAIPGDKEGCHDGTVGRSSHVGQFCHPLRCETDADCTGETTCLPGSQCIVDLIQTAGWGTGNAYEDSILAAEDGSCPEGSCEEASYCQSTNSDTSTAFHCGENVVVVEDAPEVEAEAVEVEKTASTSTQTATPTATAPEEDDSGCTCAGVPAAQSAAWLGFIGLLALGRRRG